MQPHPEEQALVIPCGAEDLVGIVHCPEHPESTGVLVLTGGPQYRVGSHRQFVLLGRSLSLAGIAVMRFDYRGMGDSSGDPTDFEHCEADIRAAVDKFLETVPGLERVVLWGLCDAASASMIYACSDARISGLVLLNPWARTEAGEAQTLLKHYYLRRLFSAEFWRGFFTGGLAIGDALRSLLGNVRQAMSSDGEEIVAGRSENFIDRMQQGLEAFAGQTLLIMSGDDLTAAEFRSLANSSRDWRRILGRSSCVQRDIPAANHTFSSAEWRSEVELLTRDWVLKHMNKPGQA